jgi:DNA-binding Lrp family transcriptional regulator
MPRPRKITDEAKLLIAMMSSEQNMSNKAIGEALRISESAVSKALKECFEEGRLQLVFNRNGLTGKQLAALQATAAGADELKRLLARFPKDASAVVAEPDVRIVDSGGTETTQPGWASRLETFGRAAAPYIGRLIAGSRVVGTSWGETLAAVVRGLAGRPAQLPKHPIQFVPLCGEMLQGPPRKVSASNLAYQLDEIVNGDLSHSHSHWLAGVPSRMPLPRPGMKDNLTPAECAAVSRYIRRLPGYRKVFGPDPSSAGRGERTPLIERLDMILTSCGPKERPLGYSGVQDLRSAGLSLRDARKLVVGDLSGILLKNPELDSKQLNPVDRINAAWAGAKLTHVRDCSRRALATGAGGTVLCGLGANKADTVLEIVRLGLAVRILVDFDLAQQLRRKL